MARDWDMERNRCKIRDGALRESGGTQRLRYMVTKRGASQRWPGGGWNREEGTRSLKRLRAVNEEAHKLELVLLSIGAEKVKNFSLIGRPDAGD